MKQDNKTYDKVLEALKINEPELENREELKNRILEHIRETDRKSDLVDRISDSLFSWTDVLWLRRTVGTMALILVGIFLFQQLSLNRKISGIEKQLVHVEAAVSTPQVGMNRGQIMLMKMYTDISSDSIKVSKDDLDQLLQEYEVLLEKYDALNSGLGEKPFPGMNKKNGKAL